MFRLSPCQESLNQSNWARMGPRMAPRSARRRHDAPAEFCASYVGLEVVSGS